MLNPIDALLGLFSLDIGIDLGTANTLVYVRGKGVVINEPSWVAIERGTKRVLAVGAEAKEMVGRTPANIVAIRPLRDGVISEFEVTQAMLDYFIKQAHRHSFVPFPRPRVVVGIPSGVTEVEKRAVYDATLAAGARMAFLIEEPMAAAIGIGLPVSEPGGFFVCDIGGGTAEIAVISLGGIVLNRSLRVAGDDFDEAILNFLRLKYSLLIGLPTAEEIKIAIGSVFPHGQERQMIVRGRDLETGLPKSLKISEAEIREALSLAASQIVAAISDLLEETPPELVSDIMNRGIVLCGGSSQIVGLDKMIAEATKMPVWVADDPQTAVVRGCGKLLGDPALLSRVRITGGLR